MKTELILLLNLYMYEQIILWNVFFTDGEKKYGSNLSAADKFKQRPYSPRATEGQKMFLCFFCGATLGIASSIQ